MLEIRDRGMYRPTLHQPEIAPCTRPARSCSSPPARVANLPSSSPLRVSCGIQVPIDQFLRSSILGGLSLTGAGTAAEAEREDESASGLAVKDAPRWWWPGVEPTDWFALPEGDVPTFGVEKAISPSEAERPCEPWMLALALAVDGGVGASGRGGRIQTAVDGVPAEVGIVPVMVLCETGRGN